MRIGFSPPSDICEFPGSTLRGADAEYGWRLSMFFLAAAVSFCRCGITY